MKITEETTLGQLMAERMKLHVEYLAINDRMGSRTCIVIADVPDAGLTTIYGHGNTEADAINDAFNELRTRRGMKEDPDAPPTAG